LEIDAQKVPGFIMKINTIGIMIELEKITFKVGSFFNVQFQFGDGPLLTERVRSIKHYDQYFRTLPKKSYAQGETPPVPKKLCEAHFQMLTETTKTQLTKYLLELQQQQQRQKQQGPRSTTPTPKKVKPET
jgi:hypothetical protein